MTSPVVKHIHKLLSQYDFEVFPKYNNKGLTCTECNRLMTDAYQTYCGCQYCRQCIIKHLNGVDEYCGGGKSECREEPLVLDRNVTSNASLNKRISKSRVPCPYESCGAINPLCEMEQHMELCAHRPMECPYSEIGCDCEMMSKQKMETHFLQSIFEHSQLVVESIKKLIAKFDLSLEDIVNERIKSNEDRRNQSIIKNKEMNEIRSNMALHKSKSSMREARRNEAIRELKSMVEAGTKRAVTLETDVSRLKEEVKGMMNESLAIREEAVIMRTRMDADRDEFRGIREEMEARVERSTEMTEAIEKLKAGIRRMQEKSIRVKSVTRMTKMEQDVRIMKEALEKEKAESREMRGEVDTLMNEVNRVNESNVRLERESTQLMNMKIEDVARIAKVERDLTILREKGEAEKGMSKRIRGEMGSLKKEVKKINERNSERMNKVIEDGTESAESAATAVRVDVLARTIDSLNIGRDRDGAVGELWFTVDGVADMMETLECFESPHLYSHANGYKLRIRVHTICNDDGPSLRVTSVVCRGEYDAVLPWPCRFSISVSAVHKHNKQPYANQIIEFGSDTANRYCGRPIDTDNPPYPPYPYKWLSIASHFASRSSSVIIEDSLSFHVVVAR